MKYKDKILHLVISLVLGMVISALISNTGCSYLTAFLSGAIASFMCGIGAEYKDCAYNKLELVYMFNFDLLADLIGALIGASIGACVTLMI